LDDVSMSGAGRSHVKDFAMSTPQGVSTMPRRLFLRRMFGTAGGLVVTAVVAACGANKAASSGSASTAAPSPTDAPTATVETATTAVAAKTTAKASATTTAASATTTGQATTAPVAAPAPAAAGGAFNAANEMAISFSYVADAAAGGRFHNPYVAVWIEDAAGAAVRSISLNYQLGRGDKWLPDLTRWFRTAKPTAAVETISSATKVPGAYKLAWDGLNDKKVPVALGDYFVCIEASREKGPYQIVREMVSVGSAPFAKPLSAKGELQDVAVELRARS
jgi:hypothetical protein